MDDAQYEAGLIQEKARQLAEDRLAKMAEELAKLRIQYKLAGEGFDEINRLREILSRPMDANVTAADYEEALKYVEGLGNIPQYKVLKNLAAAFKIAMLELDQLKRKRGERYIEK